MVHTPRTSAAPPELLKNGKRWTARWQSACASSKSCDWATATAKKVLRAALRGLALGKCIYCESALEVSGYLEIDHYVAKTVAPERAFEWLNLLPACRRCNNAKGQQDHQNALLKPDEEDPEPYFWIHPDTGNFEPHPKLDEAQARRALETIRICHLNRGALCVKRVEMLERTGRWQRHVADGGLTPMLEDEWDALSHPAAEYKFVVRYTLQLLGQHELAEYDRDRFRSTVIQSPS